MNNFIETTRIHQGVERINNLLAEKAAKLESAIQNRDIELAEKVREEVQTLLVELRMVNPAIALERQEELYKLLSDGMTKELHRELNEKK